MKLHLFFKSSLTFIFFLLLTNASLAQQTLNFSDNTLHFRQGKEYFDAKNFVAAKEEFSIYLHRLGPINAEQQGQKVLAEYYQTMCALYMSQPEAELLADRFVAEHPEHPQSVKLFRGLGNFFFDNADYNKAIKYLSRSSETNLESKYKLAVSYYELKQMQNALSVFNEIKTESVEEFALPAAYYAATINFSEKRYADAINDFKKAEGSSKYRPEIPNWIAMCYFHQGRYNELINYAEPILKQPNNTYKINELSILVAEVQYKLGYFERAVLTYQLSKRLQAQAWTNEMKYHFGFALYKTNQFNPASDELKPLTSLKDTLSQYAAFTIGLAQLKAGNLESTLQAFDQARNQSFNPNIQEEAAFNYAKVLFDMGKASETIYAVQAFNQKYPNSKFYEQGNELVAEAILNSNNVEAAVAFLKSMPQRSPKLNAAYQTLSYNLGVRAYNANQFEPAIDYFNTAINENANEGIRLQAIFGKGEALSQLKRYAEAIQMYSPLLISTANVSNPDEFIQKVRIGLAYAYFSVRDFSKANALFKTYVDKMMSNPGAKNNPNVILRLADTYLIAKKYEDALNYYTQAVDVLKSEKDYALYQKGLTLSYLNRENEARQAFRRLRSEYPNSNYVDDAFFQENVIAFNNNKYKEAITGFSDIIENKKNSPYFTQALLRRAQSYANTNQHDLAITDYKRIVTAYSTDKVAKDALIGLQEELNEVGKPEEFGGILAEFQKNAPGSVEENIELEYRAAKGIYLGEKYDKAIAPLKAFMEKYPANENVIEATYLIADASYRTGNKAEALTFYKKMVEQNAHPQVNRAIQRAAEMEYENKNLEPAIEYFKLFKSKNLGASEMLFANIGLFNSYFALQQMEKAIEILDELQSLESVSLEEKAKLNLRFAQYYEQNQNKEQERKWLEMVLKYDKNDLGAQSQLKLAQMLYDEGKFKESSDMILDKFRNVFAEASDAILGKAYLLLSDNFVGLKNIPQAKATLQSIIDNSEDAAVVESAKTKLSALPNK